MKTKFYLAALTVPAVLASCSDELENVAQVSSSVENRPVAGVVEFAFGDGFESRFNYEKANGFEVNKDVLGLYLMDNYVGSYTGDYGAICPGEHVNANTTYWMYQNHWNAMYELTNNINSNYPFRYVENKAGKKVWRNDAKLVEGNYFAMFPQNDAALNRRELWRYIEPAVALKPVSNKEKVFQNVENQFWLGYSQIYRNETATMEGCLEKDLYLKNVLIPLKLEILGWQGNDVRLDKISIRSKSGKPLPTLAYVEPKQATEWRKVTDDKDEFKDICNPDKASALGLYDAEKTWTKGTVQSLVRWSYPGAESGRIPYGLDADKQHASYEYSFSYPEGTTMDGDVKNGDLITTYLAVPAIKSEDCNDLVVTIYGWRYIKDSSVAGFHWEYGLLNYAPSTNDNYSFELSKTVETWLNQGESTVDGVNKGYYQTINVRFDNLAWKAINRNILISSTEDMEKMVKAYLEQEATGTAAFTIQPDQNSNVTIRQDFVNYLKAVSAKTGRSIKLTFDGGRKGELNFEDETMAVRTQTNENGASVEFSYSNNIVLKNAAKQTIKDYTLAVTLVNTGEIVVTDNGQITSEVTNFNKMTVAAQNDGKSAFVNRIYNNGALSIGKHATVRSVENHMNVEVAAGKDSKGDNYLATISILNNTKHNDCEQCPAEVVVKNGTLNISELHNSGTFDVKEEAEMIVLGNNPSDDDTQGSFFNATRVLNDVELSVLTNEGKITIVNTIGANLGQIDNFGTLTAYALYNYGVINNGNTVKKGILTSSKGNISNFKKIYAHKGEIKVLRNEAKGVLYVTAVENEVETSNTSTGNIIFKGVDAQHIGTKGKDTRIFELKNAMKTSELFPIMRTTATTVIKTAHDLTLNFTDASEVSKKIDYIYVDGKKVNFKGEQDGKSFTLAKANLVVKKECELHIEGATKLTVAGIDVNSKGNIHTGSNSKLTGADVDVEHTDFSAE